MGGRQATLRRDSISKIENECKEWDKKLEPDFPAVVPLVMLAPEDQPIADHEIVGRKAKKEMFRSLHAVLTHRPLATGSFGVVYKGVIDRQQVAVKIFNINKLLVEWKEGFIKDFPRELAIIKRLSHPNIVITHNIFLQLTTGRVELADIDLANFLVKVIVDAPHELQANGWFRQIAEGLNYMHTKNWSHRDVKPLNCLVFQGSETIIKLTDFGFARSVIDPTLKTRVMSETYEVVTRNYRAPEIFMKIPYDPIPADVWSLGVSLFLIINRVLPFIDPDVRTGRKSKVDTDWDKILEMQLTQQFTFERKVSGHCKDLIRGMVNPVVEQRLTMAQVLAHPWVSMTADSAKSASKSSSRSATASASTSK